MKSSRFIANSGFWGRLGHGNAVTAEAYLPWIRAAIMSPSIEVDDLLSTYYNLVPQLGNNFADAKEKPVNANRNIRMADMLRDYHLNKSEKA